MRGGGFEGVPTPALQENFNHTLYVIFLSKANIGEFYDLLEPGFSYDEDKPCPGESYQESESQISTLPMVSPGSQFIFSNICFFRLALK